ncbi:MAG: hypothetical protein A2X61_14800 [Ignavibacteria bacterium GWB2_35_12]|nr:MAG: hypothetical protein A2X63_06730 [Ignavibacteria bacterium GWA2_35_8]OGU38350.1 MAG: hypothetical protein A2X61_14800 [Ignavibacteria bacterium GWB2_35_12]OGU94202.1 MAG: hypothetical protein A2220_01715 [Ignavibacteria bacterium RIFOXYA2_FULL_35_10]OGV23414.1 MAG: hypothetical protein A2475_06455 [Ignavibacteria bacterium RIFOXYC2_FULL_35_21]
MSPSNVEITKHIFDEIEFILKQTSGIDFLTFSKDGVLQRAVIRSFEIIGEASKKLSVEFKSKYQAIPWKEMAGFRDVLIHDYFGVDIEIVWDIAENQIPKIEPQIKQLIDAEEGRSGQQERINY